MINKTITIIIIGVLILGIASAGIAIISDVYTPKDKITDLKSAGILSSKTNNNTIIISPCKKLDNERCVAIISNEEGTYSKEIFLNYAGKDAKQIEEELIALAKARVDESYKVYQDRKTAEASKAGETTMPDTIEIRYIEDKSGEVIK